MPIKLTTTAPVTTVPTANEFEVFHLELHRGIDFSTGVRIVDVLRSYIEVRLIGQNNIVTICHYYAKEADDLIIALDKAPLNVKDLQSRVIERLLADGKLVGTISGAPE
jgi:hypothetical protein